jgi:hypothetical protein
VGTVLALAVIIFRIFIVIAGIALIALGVPLLWVSFFMPMMRSLRLWLRRHSKMSASGT